MDTWRQTLTAPDTPIIDAMEAMNDSSFQILLVVDGDNILLGTVTDGDIRRGLIRSVAMDDAVSKIMNPDPVTGSANESRDSLFEKMSSLDLRHIPIINLSRTVIGLERVEQLIVETQSRDNWVVLMAGGLGSRLRPLTDDTPKPLLHIGDKPVLEHIIANFIKYGFRKFYISVNYKADVLMDYFKDGTDLGCEIRYIKEQEKTGTAGALALIEEQHSAPILVMNGDLLTSVNCEHLLNYHIESKVEATMCVSEYDFTVPYGVIEVGDDNVITRISEKPVHKFFVNAGIYVLNPSVFKYVDGQGTFNMTTLFERLAEAGLGTTIFPLTEYWLDIGLPEDFERAKKEIAQRT